jgi:hypothetical protein
MNCDCRLLGWMKKIFFNSVSYGTYFLWMERSWCFFLFVEVDSGAARIDLITLEVRLCIVVVRLLGWKIVLLIRSHMVPILVDEIMEFSYCCTLFWFLLPMDRWMDEKGVEFLDGWPHIQVRLWIVAVTFLDEKRVDVFPYLCNLFHLFWFCCQWMDRWMKKELTFQMRDSYGGEIMDCGCHLLVCFYFVANGWMDGWIDGWKRS